MFSLSEERSLWAQNLVQTEGREDHGVGTLSEKSVHAVLKHALEQYADSREVRLGDYVADIVGEHGVIEIQTKDFKGMRKKLTAFLPLCPVTSISKRARPFPAGKAPFISAPPTSSGNFTRSATCFPPRTCG